MSVSHSDIAHAWANKTKDGARGSRMYFDGARIYSHGSHFVIAEHVTNKAGAEAVLFTERDYSVSTSQHKSIVRNAASHLRLIYVPDLDRYSNDAQAIFRVWLDMANGIYKRFHKASKTGKAKEARAMLSLYERVHAYADFFSARIPAALVELFTIAHGTAWQAVLSEDQERQAARELNRANMTATQHARQLDEWRNFERDYLRVRLGFDYLRYNETERRIETSQSVRIPRTAARRMYYWLLKVRESGGCQPCEYTIMSYTVRSVTADFLRVGCHNIPFSEVEAIAARLQWDKQSETEAERREEPQPSAAI